MVHARENSSGAEVGFSATDTKAMQACEIAAELSADQGYPGVEMLPIAKVAVLLLDPTKKKCLIDYGADTKGVWSIIEKEYDTAAGISHSTNQPAGQESTKKATFGSLDAPLILQQLAISEVQRRTGRFLSLQPLIYISISAIFFCELARFAHFDQVISSIANNIFHVTKHTCQNKKSVDQSFC
jgi:hypothetical protein